jgi:hypothetical protein
MINFGVEGQGLGVFLVLLNLIILFLAGWLAYASFYEQKHRNILKEQKVYRVTLPAFNRINKRITLFLLHFCSPFFFILNQQQTKRQLVMKKLAPSVTISSTLPLTPYGSTVYLLPIL